LGLTGSLAAAQTPARTTFQPVPGAEQCPAHRSPIMILGTYHMGNPGMDAINIEADDVLSPRRQKEIAQLVNQLARFRPTKVMIEADYKSAVPQQRYEQYLAGTYTLSRNETDQIAYRLAKQAGLKSVTPVDFPMWMSGQTYAELEFKPTPAKTAAAEAPPPPKPPEAVEAERRLRESTVSEYLLHTNGHEQWHDNNHLRYMDLFEPDPNNVAIYANVDNLTNWYKRNFRMFSNIVRKTERPKDRVFMIVGSGHLAILRNLAQDMPGFCLVEPHAYLKG
jgi:hypothetical protein